MVQPHELRIGNALKCGDRIVFVSAIFRSHFRCETKEGIDYEASAQKRFEPIPLTEDILLKCGFVNNKLPIIRGFDFGYIYFSNSEIIFRDDKGFGRSITYKYLHQLQNLHFSLTGNELEVNL